MSAAVLERERRATAGKRMTTLMGKALEEDQTFWGHDTWEEDNESFHESDEDSALQRDEFDSDFDESETDNEQEEREAGEEEERLILKEERKQRHSNYAEIAKAGRSLLKKKKAPKRAIGDGVNAGIVLNLPGSTTTSQQKKSLGTLPKPLKSATSVTIATTRPRRSKQGTHSSARTRSTRIDTTDEQSSTKRKLSPASAGKTKKARQQQFTQEELLLEAVKETEPENLRWLLGRKRIQDQNDNDKEGSNREIRGKVIEKFISRRGTLNTITFPEMDHLPEIFKKHSIPAATNKSICVITGKPARYRDPKTRLPYYDAVAFKELRRRFEAGELSGTTNTDSEPKKTKNAKAKSNLAVDGNLQNEVNRPDGNPSEGLTNPDAGSKNANSLKNHLEPEKVISKMPIKDISSKKKLTKRKGKKESSEKDSNGANQASNENDTSTPNDVATNPMESNNEASHDSTEGKTDSVSPKEDGSTISPLISLSHPESPNPQHRVRLDSAGSHGSNHSRRSPRRRKPSARVLESFDQSGLPYPPIPSLDVREDTTGPLQHHS